MTRRPTDRRPPLLTKSGVIGGREVLLYSVDGRDWAAQIEDLNAFRGRAALGTTGRDPTWRRRRTRLGGPTAGRAT